MAEEGGQVIICSRKEENLKEALEKLKDFKCEGLICDVSIKEERLKALNFIEQKFGRIDVLVCNQGGNYKLGNQLEMTEE